MPVVLFERDNRIGAITLNLPEKRNPLNTELVEELIACLDACAADDEISVVLLSANGDSFCAGGDLREFTTYRDKGAGDIYQEGMGTATLFKRLADYPKPVVAAINGPAYGGGFGIACACPIVVASEKARFGATELRLGLFPLVILPAIRAAMGDREALALSLTGRTIDVEEARAKGLVHVVAAHDALVDEARKVAQAVASFSPYALRMGMDAFRVSTGMSAGTAIDYLNALRVMFFHSEDLKEGASAFLEKRQPNWVGR